METMFTLHWPLFALNSDRSHICERLAELERGSADVKSLFIVAPVAPVCLDSVHVNNSVVSLSVTKDSARPEVHPFATRVALS